ncbi:hypothetical protein HUG17_3498 [Dermatophagoides farinae]|uniref:Uncharacterized protein n=1 Tax=Dermatophagoides farinae TaxID=6954 RepID=A0A9D4NUI6_DERFA|nr:hypothetical protein HUG17_3498 [Dermatophagoides farinae]
MTNYCLAVLNEQDEVTKENAVVWDHNITVDSVVKQLSLAVFFNLIMELFRDSDEQIETTTIIGKVINKASSTNSELVVLGWICHFLDSELVVLGHGFFMSYLYRINVNLSSECECG